MGSLSRKIPFINLLILLILYAALSLRYIQQAPIPLYPRDAQYGMQMLDLEWIRESFWQCLVYNHYQPPLFGTILIGSLYIFCREWLIPVYYALSYGLSFSTLVGFVYLANRLRINQFWIFIFGCILATYPARWEFEAQIFYPLPSMALLTGMGVCFARALETRRAGYLGAAFMLGAALTLINSFFHFGFMILIFLLMTALARMSSQRRARIWLILATVLVLIVPVKNYLVFGFFGSSSCSGIVLVQRAHVMRLQMEGHAYVGDIASPSADYYTGMSYLGYDVPEHPVFSKIKCLSYSYKEYGSRLNDYMTFNFNHWKVWAASKRMMRDALWLISHYPNQYIKGTGFQFRHFFAGTGRPLDPVLSTPENLENGPHVSFRGLLYVLGTLAVLISLCVRPFNAADTEDALLFFILTIIAYALFMGIMIAYLDGPRYRFPFEIYFLLAATWACDRVSRVFFKHRRRAA